MSILRVLLSWICLSVAVFVAAVSVAVVLGAF